MQPKLYLYFISLIFTAVSITLPGCRGEEYVLPAEEEKVAYDLASADPSLQGIYLLNEGNMGSNKCTLDYLDLSTGIYNRNIYPQRNPNVAKELGDVGNDIGIYGSKMYIVVNCSHKVEVVDAQTGIRISQIDIPNCRNLQFHEGKAYISSYVGPVAIGTDVPKGAVYEVDTLSLAIARSVTVGYQPEEMEIIDGMLYVANSGGYCPPEYDNTISVVRLSDFRQVQQIIVGKNPGRLRKDQYNRLWVSSRGDNTASSGLLQMFTMNARTGKMEIQESFPIPVANMAIHEDRLYYFTSTNDVTGTHRANYGSIDLSSLRPAPDSFISDGTEREITIPYGIAVMPQSGNILITDAKNYVSSGMLHCYSPAGNRLWSVRTGDIPAHIAFLRK